MNSETKNNYNSWNFFPDTLSPLAKNATAYSWTAKTGEHAVCFYLENSRQFRHPVYGNPFDTAIVHLPTQKFTHKEKTVSRLTRSLLEVGFHVAIYDVDRLFSPSMYFLGSEIYDWPKNAFCQVPGSNLIFTLPIPTSSSDANGYDYGAEVFHETLNLFGKNESRMKYQTFPSLLGIGGWSVWAGNVVLVQASAEFDPGVIKLRELGFEVLCVPHIKEKPDSINISASSQDVDQVNSRTLNDDIDTEVRLIRDDVGRYLLLVNTSFALIFQNEISCIVNRLRIINDRILESVNDIVGNFPVVYVPLDEEKYLPANLITGPDGRLIITAKAKQTIKRLSQVISSERIIPFELENNDDTIGPGGNLGCVVNEMCWK